MQSRRIRTFEFYLSIVGTDAKNSDREEHLKAMIARHHCYAKCKNAKIKKK